MKKVEIGKVKIRFAKSGDFEEIISLLEEITKAISGSEASSSYDLEASISSRRNIFKKILAGENKIFVSKYQDRIVSVLNLQLIPNVRYGRKRGHVEELIVKRGFRGQGIGSLMLKNVIEWCQKNDISVIKVMPRDKLKRAQKFLEKHGFVSKYKGYRLDLQ